MDLLLLLLFAAKRKTRLVLKDLFPVKMFSGLPATVSQSLKFRVGGVVSGFMNDFNSYRSLKSSLVLTRQAHHQKLDQLFENQSSK